MAISDRPRWYTPQSLWRLFVLSALPVHVWALVMFFADLVWISERTNLWDALGVGAYALLFALIESVLLFGVAALLGFVVPRRWMPEGRLALMGVLSLAASFWAIAGQLAFLWQAPTPAFLVESLATNAHPLRILYLLALLGVSATVAVPAILVARSLNSPAAKAEKAVGALAERLSTLVSLYLFFDFCGLLIVLYRNFFASFP